MVQAARKPKVDLPTEVGRVVLAFDLLVEEIIAGRGVRPTDAVTTMLLAVAERIAARTED